PHRDPRPACEACRRGQAQRLKSVLSAPVGWLVLAQSLVVLVLSVPLRLRLRRRIVTLHRLRPHAPVSAGPLGVWTGRLGLLVLVSVARPLAACHDARSAPRRRREWAQ